LLLLFFLDPVSSATAQVAKAASPCAGPKGIASVSPKVLNALTLTTKMPNPHEAGKKAIEIASQPGSGLKVAYVLKDNNGVIIRYAIAVVSAPNCYAATMVFHSEQNFPRPHDPEPLVDVFGHSRSPFVARVNVLHFSKTGAEFETRPDGHVSQLIDPKRGLAIVHGLNGAQRVSVEDHNHNRTVFQKGRLGYVQHPFSYRGHEFAKRTFFYHGHAYSHLYAVAPPQTSSTSPIRFSYGYGYREMFLDVYAPSFYYGQAFYGWVYNPWLSPIAYGWGWAGNSWFGYYGYYFAPYPSYPSASYWLTDYMISSDLQTAYDAHQDAGEVDGIPPTQDGPPILTPEIKQQVADEVNGNLALENQEAQLNAAQLKGHNLEVAIGSSSIYRLLNDASQGRPHVFMVGTPLDVVDASRTECTLSDGDVLSLRSAPSPGTIVNLVVLLSKGGQECQNQSTVSVSWNYLQEMQNHMRAIIDQGLKELVAKQGKGGLPLLPSGARAAPVPSHYAAFAPPPDPNAAIEIQRLAQQADQAEKEVITEVSRQGGTQ
jgi:hypothetical protein